jgi:hypothetical protein
LHHLRSASRLLNLIGAPNRFRGVVTEARMLDDAASGSLCNSLSSVW